MAYVQVYSCRVMFLVDASRWISVCIRPTPSSGVQCMLDFEASSESRESVDTMGVVVDEVYW